MDEELQEEVGTCGVLLSGWKLLPLLPELMQGQRCRRKAANANFLLQSRVDSFTHRSFIH